METKQKVITTLNELAADYSDLISKRKEADNLCFEEKVPQPSYLQKVNGATFDISDCEKIISGNYKLNGEIVSGGKVDGACLGLTYKSIVKREISKPVKKVPTEPLPPQYDRELEHPILAGLSVVAFIMLIASIALTCCGYYIFAYLIAVFLTATLVLCVKGGGGIFAIIILLVRYPQIKRERRQDRDDYKSDMEQYLQAIDNAQLEYDSALKDYERQLAEIEKDYREESKRLYETVLSEIKTYTEICKEYFARKKKVEKEIEKQKADIKSKYEAVALKLKSYSDTMPAEFLKVPVFENATCYDLRTVREKIEAYISILESGRADNLKEASNCYVSDQQAEEQKRILEEQAMEQRRQAEERLRMEEARAEEQRRILEQQAEDQRRQANRQWWLDERRAEEQQRIDEEQKRNAERQSELAQKQVCATSQCPLCDWRCGMSYYSPDGRGGCYHFRIKSK